MYVLYMYYTEIHICGHMDTYIEREREHNRYDCKIKNLLMLYFILIQKVFYYW